MASRIGYREELDNYTVIFCNPVDKKEKKRKDGLSKDKAIEQAQKWDSEFYGKNKSNIPSGISLDTSTGRFRVYTRYGYLPKSTFYTIMEALEFRNNTLLDLTEPKYLTSGKIKLFTND